MNESSLNPVQQSALTSFRLERETKRHQAAQLRNARFGPTWAWVGLAAAVWLEIVAGFMANYTSVTGRIALGAAFAAICVFGYFIMRGIGRAREALFLAIIAREAPESYRRLKEERIIA